MNPAPPVSRIRMASSVPARHYRVRASRLQTCYGRPVVLRWPPPLSAWRHVRGAGAGRRRRAHRPRGRLALPGAGRLPRGHRRRRQRRDGARAVAPGPAGSGRARPDAAGHGRSGGLPPAARRRARPDRDADRPRPRGRPDRRAGARRGRLRGQAVQPPRAGRQGPQRAAPQPRRSGRPAGPPARRRPHDRPGDKRGRNRRPPGRADRSGVRAAAVPRPPPAPGLHPRAAPAAGLGVHLARRHLDRHSPHPPAAREGRGPPLRPAARPDRLRGRLPLRPAGAVAMSGRRRAAATATAVFAGGLLGSVAVALAVAIPARDLAILLGLTSLGAVVVVLVGLAVQAGLRRRRAGVARHVALTAVVTAGAGIAYGVASSRGMVTDLEALARRAAALESGASPPPAEPRPGGAAEVATVAEALDAATARLVAARDRERAMEAGRRDLVAWISHDLRTPLASLRALAEALADGVATDEAARVRYLGGLVAHVDRLTALADALLELSQVEAGALTLELEPVSLPELVAEVVQCFEPQAKAAGVRLEATAAAAGTVVLAGRDQLNRVLANLVHNGIRHTPPGGRLLVTMEEPTGDGAVVVRVRDGCGGIAAPDLPKVFDRLWRGDPARSSRGAGLGLAIARGFVEAHGGTITVANVPGGCQFTMKLPGTRDGDAFQAEA